MSPWRRTPSPSSGTTTPTTTPFSATHRRHARGRQPWEPRTAKADPTQTWTKPLIGPDLTEDHTC
jgi:hypothetical protein